MRININVDLRVGRVVKYFILVDLALLAGWGLIDPIFSIFIVNYVAGATLVTVGITTAMYWFLKSMLQMPFANYLDRTSGEKDDFYALILGLFIVSFAAFSFTLVHEQWQLYVTQALKAVGFSLYAATWPAIFSRHLDKDRVSFDWAFDSTAVSISAGAAGLMGSIIAKYWGFSSVFLFGGFFSLLSALVLVAVPDLILPPKTTTQNTGRENRPPAEIVH